MLKVANLSFGFAGKPLYKGVNFTVAKGQKVGLVGPNGSGKSTLLSIILGKEEGYLGRVNFLGKIGFVPQEIKYDSEMAEANNIRDYIDLQKNHSDHELTKIINHLGLKIDLDQNPVSLSGGQKTKLALARALLSKPDLLLLDEPTNFMDDAGKAWVMDFLAKYNGAVIVISHDLKLMDSAIDKVLVISPYSQSIDEYKGTYSDYIRLKKQKDENLRKEFTIKSKHLKRMEEGYKKLGKYDEKRTIWRHRIEREQNALPAIPPELKSIKIKLSEPKRIGELPIRVIDLVKSYNQKVVLRDLSLSVYRGERLMLIGPNGTGKSTLIKILMGNLSPDSGSVVKDSDLVVGYYSQEFENFDLSKSVLEEFCYKTNKDRDFARAFLGKFLFSNQKVFQNISSLSGGEKTRLSIACLTAGDNNMLILDEPTTYLDVLSQRIILEALKEYRGTMLLVSHTAEFVKELNPNRALLFPEQKIVLWDDEILGKVEEI